MEIKRTANTYLWFFGISRFLLLQKTHQQLVLVHFSQADPAAKFHEFHEWLDLKVCVSLLSALTCSSEVSEDFSGCILSDVQRQLTFYPMISQTLRGAGLSPRSEVQTAFLTATHDVTCSTFWRKYVREAVKFKKMIEFLCVPCCWAGLQPHSRASPVSLPVQSSWLFVWSSVSKPGGPSHRVQECVSWALWLWKHVFFLTSSRHMHSFLG